MDWFRALLSLYGISTRIIEEDSRGSIDWLKKSLDAIHSTNFVLALLTKRYQFTNEAGMIVGWKAPDKCYDEVAMSFALRKDLFALVEEEVEPGNVLQTRAWCYRFNKEPQGKAPTKADVEFFRVLDSYVNPQ